jgi:hypothetical protein
VLLSPFLEEDKMTAQKVLAKAKRFKISLWCESGALKFEAPHGALTDALRAEIHSHKFELLALLQHGDAYAPQAAPAADGARFWVEVAAAIQDARRGPHLAYTPALAWAWRAVNQIEGREFNSCELCNLVRSKTDILAP